MATPTILVDSSTGSDTAASGAGPSTAISGSTGRTRNTASQSHFGLFGATDDLAGVATDGTHVLYAGISTAGQRNFSSISAVKNTRQTGSDAAITSGTATLVVGSTTGWTAGDVIKVTGAGAASADLYSTILTVDSGVQATLNDNAGTTVATAAWENPKQVTLTSGQELNTGATNTAWGIGGKRLTIGGTNSFKLVSNNSAAGDAMPGWIIELGSGYTETLAATYAMRRAGDTTNGRITLRGASGGTRPVLTFSNNGNMISMQSDYLSVDFLELRNTNATKTASIGVITTANNEFIRNILINHSDKPWKGISVGAEGAILRGNYIAQCASDGITTTGTAAFSMVIANNYVAGNGGHGFNIGGTILGIGIYGNISAFNTGDGIRIAGTGTTVGRQGYTLVGNTIHGNGGDGVEISSASTALAAYSDIFLANNNITYNGGYAFNFSGTSVTNLLLSYLNFMLLNNNHYANTSGLSNLTLTIDENTTNIDPAGGIASATKDYAGATSGTNFMVGTALKAKGYPLGGTLAIGTGSSTYSYVDQGAAQRQEPTSSSGIAHIIGG